jgi:hypothetical protein
MDTDKKLLPVDLLVAMKLAVSAGEPASGRALSKGLGLPHSSVALSLHRLHALGLLRDDGQVNKLALRDCLQHAVRWIAPAEVGDFELGLLTAHAAPSMAAKLSGDDDPLVIPLPHGPKRGRAVTPIHRAAPAAAAKDAKLHQLLAVVDSFRVGGAREREVASAELRSCL